MNLKERTYLWYIAALRIYVGYYFLWQGYRKYQRDFPSGDWIGRQIGDIPGLDLYPWYKKILAQLRRASFRNCRVSGHDR